MPTIFSDNPVLETVSFRRNPLLHSAHLPPILASLSIEFLDLSYCTLTSINADTFSQLPNLKFLNLNSNRLREIKLEQFNNLTELINVDLGNNMWKCDCKNLEVLNMLYNRRKSISVDGEHTPVKCFEEGEYKNISTAEFTNNCTGQAEKERSTFLEPKPEERPAKDTSTIFKPKDIEKKFQKPEIWINNVFYGIGMGIFFGFTMFVMFVGSVLFCVVKLQRLLKALKHPNPTSVRIHKRSEEQRYRI
jgi:uncharacterized membrane-anchored protein YitT (DUF2179 family)